MTPIQRSPRPTQKRRRRALFFVLVLAITACVRGSNVPEVAPHGTLSLGDANAGPSKPPPFAVAFAGPKGKASSVSEVSIVFTRPLRALDLAGDEQPPPVTITPEVEGRWQWVGTRALLFVPRGGRLPAATRFEVEVPADTRALDGTRLGKAHRFGFSTPRPRLVRSVPSDGSRDQLPNVELALRFNQPIDPGVLERSLTLTATTGGKTRKLAFEAVRPDPAQPKRVEIRPKHRLPVHSAISLKLSGSLTGEQGPLPAGKQQLVAFHTYGPLAVRRVDCPRDTPNRLCAPGSGLGISLSNPVKMRDLKQVVRVQGVRTRWDNWHDDDEYTTYAEITGPFSAGRSYTLRVAGSLTDRYGQKLGKPYVERIAFDDHWPQVEVGIEGQYLEPSSAAPIPVGSVNVDQYRLWAAALDPAQASRFEAQAGSAQRIRFLGKLAKPRTVKPRAAKNRLFTHRVSEKKLLGGKGRGPVVVGVRYRVSGGKQKPRDVERVEVVQVTDLAVTAKLSKYGSLVWVTRLSTGAPVQGAKVRVLGAGKPKSKTIETSASGVAELPAADYAPEVYGRNDDVLVVSAGDDWSYRRIDDYVRPWRLDVPTDYSGRQSTYGLLFTERGIYRPGDVVHLKGVMRHEVPTGNAVPRGLTFWLELYAPSGDAVAKKRVTTTRFGTFATQFRIPQSARLGSWWVKSQGLPKGTLNEYFDVAEYRPAEFEVKVQSNQPSYVRGDDASWTIHGDYLFGAPMSGADVRYTVTRNPSWFVPPDSEGFVVGGASYFADRDSEALDSAPLAQKTTKLGPKGRAELSASLSLPGQREPELVTVDAEVSDVSRQALSGSTSAVVHPAELYVGIDRPDDWFVDAPGSVPVGIVALSPKGKRLAGKRVEVELIRRRWTVVRQQTSGRAHTVSRPVDTKVSQCEVTTRGSAQTCTLKLKEGGYYLIRATSKDARGNLAESATGIYAIGAGRPSWGDSDDLQVELVPDKKQYQIGDTARVLVKSPFREAEALVTVERAGIYESRRVTLRGPTPTVSVPVTDELRPNAFVSVHLLKGRSRQRPAKGPDVGAPSYRMGYARLDIDPEARRLDVSVRPNKTDLRPGETLKVDVRVRDAAGKPAAAEVTLYAADEGVLQLIGYKTPDPIPVFTAARPLQVAVLESRDALARLTLAELSGALGLDKGEDGGDGGRAGPTSARRDFRQSAYFNPSVLTDAEGHAQVSFPLPESLTTFRVMAIAVSEGDRYGFGNSRVTTSKPLMARPALPRFIRAGDHLEAGVVISSKGLAASEVTVRAKLEGLTLEGEPTRRIHLDANASKEVRFPMLAKQVGNAKLLFDVRTEGAKDSVEVERSVKLPAQLEAVALYGSTGEASGEKLGNLSAIRRDVGYLEVSLASTALVGLDAGVEQLIDYPYGCTEQLSSRLMPMLPLRDLARDYGFPLPKNTKSVVNKTVADILTRQRGDGGFGMWPDSPESSPWVSAYAAWTLHEAQARGVKLPKTSLERARSYLRRYLEQRHEDELYLATAAFMVDVLAELDAPDVGYMSRLYEKRDQLPLFAKALLLHAMVKSQQKLSLIRELSRELENHLRLDGNVATVSENLGDEYAVLMDSPVRTSAMVLRALMAAEPSHALGEKLARGLLRARRGGHWRSTQETTFALLALDDYRKAQEKTEPSFSAKVWMGETALFDAAFRGRDVRVREKQIPTRKLSGASGSLLVFQKDGKGTLYYEARLRYARRTLPSAGLDRGFYVQRILRKVTPGELDGALSTIPERGAVRFSGGDLVLADLVVVTPSPRDFVVIDDPLPAGFEAVDARLSTTASWLDVPASGGEPSVDCLGCDDEVDDELAHGRAFLQSWYRRELRDDRVLFFVDHMAAGMYHYRYLARATTLGSFIVPPTKAEEMYSPEVFGRTGALRVGVE